MTIDIQENKKTYIELLRSTKRLGIETLISYIETTEFFIQPASTRFHLNVVGGLCQHSLNLYYNFIGKIITCNNYDLTDELKNSIIIAALLHDMCKNDLYEPTEKSFKVRRFNAKGHAKKSLMLIEKHILLQPLEENMITYHMGIWDTIEFVHGNCEYTTKELIQAWNKWPLVHEFHASDNYVSKFIEQ